MKLSDLIRALPQAMVTGGADLEVRGLAYDSRRVGRGFLFVAVPGAHTDGHDFVGLAVVAGAVAVVSERPITGVAETVTSIVVPDSREALADLAAAFYGYPARRLRVIGVTGTDGKTTTSFLIGRVLRRARFSTGLIGTVDFRVADRQWSNDSRQTTPESPEIQALLADMVRAGVDYAVLESTSHGLAQHRVANCDYDVAVMTNVTHEHLEFHQTVDEYRKAKARLFEMMGSSARKGIAKVGVINLDDANASYFIDKTPGEVITYACDRSATIRAIDIQIAPKGASFTVQEPRGSVALNLQLTGPFNVYNALAAVAVGCSQGVPLLTIKEALEDVVGIPGRMERIDEGQAFTVLVDYAHTPEAFAKVLGMLRPITGGKLIIVFGSAGERDVAKRPMQGQMAARFCDFFVLTNEDPRLEDEMEIIDAIAAGGGSSPSR
ncbi:MAG: UDP-N-acetylmuramoyl-L-alanyl-D-glutamate--2,6-diaminopimelate ligase, partial [Chloroflexi bacterium]|nr:UDP-N-acetylmuramoyl-L-alanyl-D-glutamate--2,6-diaminopimelate ligase [Chloroflexota bacterium]